MAQKVFLVHAQSSYPNGRFPLVLEKGPIKELTDSFHSFQKVVETFLFCALFTF